MVEDWHSEERDQRFTAGDMTANDGDGHLQAGLDTEQRKALPPFASLRAFEAIGTCGGIRRAAQALSIDHAAISRHLRALELWTGVALIDRRPGAGRALTEIGWRYHRAIAKGLALIATASLDLTRRTSDNHLTFLCAPGLASEWLCGRLGDFSDLHEGGLELEIRPTEETPGLNTHSVDAHIHYVIDVLPPELEPELRSVVLARPPIIAVASPKFLAGLSQPTQPADLLDMPLLHEANFDQWRRWFAQYGVATEGRLCGSKFWHAHLTLAAAKRGKGIALTNSLLALDSLESGELVKLGEWMPVHLGSYMFTTRRARWRDATIVSFRRWLETQIKASEQAPSA